MLRKALLALVLVLLSACASKETRMMGDMAATRFDLAKFDTLEIMSGCANGLHMPFVAMNRIENRIRQEIREREPNRFKTRYESGPGDMKLLAIVRYLHFDDPKTLKRLLEDGEGQIRIVANLRLENAHNGQVEGVYHLDKVFAGGGVVSGRTAPEVLENDFAATVAAILLGDDPERGYRSAIVSLD